MNCPDLAGRHSLMDLVRWQVGFGPRYPGAPAHAEFRKALSDLLRAYSPECVVQRFDIALKGKTCECSNIIGIFRSPNNAGKAPLLIGTHFDTRPIADNEPEESARMNPILGANDGGSGTAVLLSLLPVLAKLERERDVYAVFFDAEDVGGLDGNEFGAGAAFFCGSGLLEEPEDVIILDMIGGRNMILDIDAHIFRHPASQNLTESLFALGAGKRIPAFVNHKEHRFKFIGCDHTPFMEKGIASALLIDIDYPEWHTHADLPDAMEEASLQAIREVLVSFLSLQ